MATGAAARIKRESLGFLNLKGSNMHEFFTRSKIYYLIKWLELHEAPLFHRLCICVALGVNEAFLQLE